jgi:hypothetical protein
MLDWVPTFVGVTVSKNFGRRHQCTAANLPHNSHPAAGRDPVKRPRGIRNEAHA